MSGEPTLESVLVQYLEGCGGWEHRRGVYYGWIDRRRLPLDGLRGVTLPEAAARQVTYEAEGVPGVD